MTILTGDLALSELSENSFRKIRKMVHGICGINLHEGKKQLIRARLSKRIRELGFDGFNEYVEFVEHDQSNTEFSKMVDALTTNKTEFFREPAHFDFLKKRIPELDGSRLRIWSAGCSTGEEPYSIAIMLKEFARPEHSDFRILATDISSKVLDTAKKGIYRDDTISTVPPVLRNRSFSPVRNNPGMFKVHSYVRGLVDFARLNLMDEWPMKGTFDMIFCRNVMIYFDKETQKKVLDRFVDILNPGGYLFTGHSESLAGLNHSLTYIQPAVYRK